MRPRPDALPSPIAPPSVGRAAEVAGRRRGWAPALIALALLAPLGGPRGQTLELSAEASDLHMLAHFAVWPPQAFASPAAPFVICLQGRDPFEGLLDRAVAAQRVGGRAIKVSRLDRIDSGSGCQIAYVAGSAVQSRAEALEAARAAPILTVTDQAAGPGPRGIVHFVLVGGRVRFEIDQDLAKASGVTLSSKLLALAVRVMR